jgi:hypothetical protein
LTTNHGSNRTPLVPNSRDLSCADFVFVNGLLPLNTIPAQTHLINVWCHARLVSGQYLDPAAGACLLGLSTNQRMGASTPSPGKFSNKSAAASAGLSVNLCHAHIARALVIRTRVLLSKCVIQKYVAVRDRFIVLTRNLHH